MVETQVAEVDLGIDWPSTSTALRGAVIRELAHRQGPAIFHSDWNGRIDGPESETLDRPAPIYYRVNNGRPSLYLWGPRTADRIHDLAAIQSLRLPRGDEQTPQVRLTVHTTAPVGYTGRQWHRYEVVTPWYPPTRAQSRRPDPSAPWAVFAAWWGDALLQNIRVLCATLGENLDHRAALNVDTMHRAPVGWDRPEKELHDRTTGLVGSFVTNVLLPNGIGLGQHPAEGFGETRLIETHKVSR